MKVFLMLLILMVAMVGTAQCGHPWDREGGGSANKVFDKVFAWRFGDVIELFQWPWSEDPRGGGHSTADKMWPWSDDPRGGGNSTANKALGDGSDDWHGPFVRLCEGGGGVPGFFHR